MASNFEQADEVMRSIDVELSKMRAERVVPQPQPTDAELLTTISRVRAQAAAVAAAPPPPRPRPYPGGQLHLSPHSPARVPGTDVVVSAGNLSVDVSWQIIPQVQQEVVGGR